MVDDKLNIQRLVQDYLSEQGFHVITANNGRDALYAARNEPPDLILLDIMMPEMDGYTFLETYRHDNITPVILLTAKLDESDKVYGLELGADDYVTKPFGMAELTARIRAVLRRAEGYKEVVGTQKIEIGDLFLEKETHVVKLRGEEIPLTPSEFEILMILMESPGRVYSRTELLEALQGPLFSGVERTIDVHVRNLRSKIEPDPTNPMYIETVYGVGYRCANHLE